MVVVESFHQLTSCVQSLAVNMPIIPHPVHCLVHILKMAAQEMAGLGSADLLLDDKWLSSILGEEEQSVQVDKEEKQAVDKVDKEEELAADCDKDSVRSKRRRKEKRIFDPSAVEDVSQAKRKKRLSGNRRAKDALLLQQSPYLIRPCFVHLMRINVSENALGVNSGNLEATICSKSLKEVKLGNEKLFALNEEQRQVLEAVSLIKQEDSSENVFPCPKCHREFSSLNKLKLHIDSGHEKFQAKVIIVTAFDKNTASNQHLITIVCYLRDGVEYSVAESFRQGGNPPPPFVAKKKLRNWGDPPSPCAKSQ